MWVVYTFCPSLFVPHFALQGQFLHCAGVLRYIRLPFRSVVVCLNIPPQGQVYSARSVDEPLTITKLEIPADAITPPTAKTGLVYDGTAQELIEPGQLDPEYGIFVFGGIGDQLYEFSPNIPKATSVGTCQYYHLIRGSENYAGTIHPKSIDITIAKRELSVTDVAVMEKVYDGTNEATSDEVTFGSALASETPGHVVSGVYSDCNAGDNKTIDIKVCRSVRRGAVDSSGTS